MPDREVQPQMSQTSNTHAHMARHTSERDENSTHWRWEQNSGAALCKQSRCRVCRCYAVSHASTAARRRRQAPAHSDATVCAAALRSAAAADAAAPAPAPAPAPASAASGGGLLPPAATMIGADAANARSTDGWRVHFRCPGGVDRQRIYMRVLQQRLQNGAPPEASATMPPQWQC